MAVHRLNDRAEYLLKRMAASEHRTPAEFLNQLVIDYAAGLSFADDPDLEDIPAPHAEVPIRA